MGKIDTKKKYILILSVALSLFLIASLAVSAFAVQIPQFYVYKILIDEDGNEVTDDDTVFDVEVRCGEGALVDEFGLKGGERKEVEGIFEKQSYFVEEVNLDDLPEGYSLVDYKVECKLIENSQGLSNPNSDNGPLDNGPLEVFIKPDHVCLVIITNKVEIEEEYVEPEEPEVEPEEEVEVVEEVDPEEPEVDPDEKLPRTGDARALWHFGFGGLLMVIGALLMKKFSLNSQA